MPNFLKVYSECSSFFVGFNDGVVRWLTVIKNPNKYQNSSDYLFHLKQAIKPHSKKVTCMAIDNQGMFLATGVCFFNVVLHERFEVQKNLNV